MPDQDACAVLFQPLELPCGVVLKNRIVKSAMSDSLGDGCGNPTEAQVRLYRRWAEGGVAASIIGEVQGGPRYAEKPGNLVLTPDAALPQFTALADAGRVNGALLWLQLGHAGAMSFPPISRPKGPSDISVPGLTCAALTRDEVRAVPGAFASTARLSKELGFGGVQIHAAHGFLLSQFLSPLFNKRGDEYGGTIANRMRLLLETVDAVRSAVGPGYPVALKLNATDLLSGGLDEAESLEVIAALDRTAIDLIDISGGTYFPGAQSASDGGGDGGGGGGPYFIEFARQARRRTGIPLMLTGGIKTRRQAVEAVASGDTDVVGLARGLVLDPALPNHWRDGSSGDPEFPKFTAPPEGGVTAWYTMRLSELAAGRDGTTDMDVDTALATYERRDSERVIAWNARFGGP